MINNQTKEQEIMERFDLFYDVYERTGFMKHPNRTYQAITDWWIKELNSALQEQKEKIVESIKERYTNTPESPYKSWDIDLEELINLVNQNAKLESDKVNEE